MAEPGALTLKERLARIEAMLEKINARVNYIIYALIATAAAGGGFAGIEAVARTLQ